jgi:hypothetical protein
MQLFTNKFVCVTLMRQNPLIAGGGGGFAYHHSALRCRKGNTEGTISRSSSVTLPVQTQRCGSSPAL